MAKLMECVKNGDDNNQRYPASGVAPITPRNYRDTYRQIKKYIVDNISNMSREEFESVLVTWATGLLNP